MLKERRQVAETVAAQLFAAEAAIDAAIAATATLAATIPAVTAEIRVGACVGQDALIEAMASCARLVEARSSIVASHRALSVAQKQIGLGAVNFGGWVDKVAPGGGNTVGSRSLTAVPSASLSAEPAAVAA